MLTRVIAGKKQQRNCIVKKWVPGLDGWAERFARETPFVRRKGFGIDGSQAPFQIDKAKAKELERQQIKLMHQAIQAAPAAPDGTQTKLRRLSIDQR